MLRRVALLGRQFRTMSTSIPSTMRAAQIESQGDVDVIQVKEVPVPKPGKGQVLYKLEYAGANFIDTYQRSGLYKLPMPYILGNESAGKVVALGEGVTEQSHGFKEGDTVLGYTAGGSFAEYVLASALRVVKVPQGVTSRQAATACVQGLTALTFVKEAHEVKKGEYILVQAAAGGLGLLLCQLCKHYGATVIGTTSTEEKAALAKKAGADHVILYGKPGVDVAEEIFKITGGEGIDRGVHAAFDGVGKDTFQTDLKAVRRKGSIVSIGNASGKIEAIEPLILGPKNLKLSRPVLTQYVYTRDEFVKYTDELFKLIKDGVLNLHVHAEYSLTTEHVKQVQLDMMSRKTTGKNLIVP